MKKIIPILLIIILLQLPPFSGHSLAAVGDTFNFGGIQYLITSETLLRGTVEVTSRPNAYSGSITIPATVLRAMRQYRVTAVGTDAFGECTALTNVTLPSGMTDIGIAAFYRCTNLRSISIPDSVKTIGDSAFAGCSSLSRVDLQPGLESISESAFQSCSALSAVSIPASVTDIGTFAFAGCRGLREITVESGNTAFRSQEGILYDIAGTTLLQCPGGKSGDVVVPDSVTRIADSAMNACWRITDVILPPALTEIGAEAFSDCLRLTAVALPDGLRRIGEGAFAGCKRLETVSVPASVTQIGTDAFLFCSALPSISVADGNANYSAQEGVLYNKAKTVLLCCPAGKSGSVNVPMTVRSFGSNAFNGCTEVTAVNIPKDMNRVPGFTFQLCTGLTSVTAFSQSLYFNMAAFLNAAEDFTLFIAADPQNYSGAIPRGVTMVPILSVPEEVTAYNGRAVLSVVNRCPYDLHGLASTAAGFTASSVNQEIDAEATTQVLITFDAALPLPATVSFTTSEGIVFQTKIIAGSAGGTGEGTAIPETGDRAPLLAAVSVFVLALLAYYILQIKRRKLQGTETDHYES